MKSIYLEEKKCKCTGESIYGVEGPTCTKKKKIRNRIYYGWRKQN